MTQIRMTQVAPTAPSAPLLDVQHLTKSFGG